MIEFVLTTVDLRAVTRMTRVRPTDVFSLTFSGNFSGGGVLPEIDLLFVLSFGFVVERECNAKEKNIAKTA